VPPTLPYKVWSAPSTGETLPLDTIKAQQLVNIEALRSGFDEKHRRAKAPASSHRSSARRHQNIPTAVPASFDIGDFVLVAKRDFRGGEKLALRWHGPYRILAIRSDYVTDVEDLLTKAVSPVHSTRLRLYHDPSLEVTADIKAHLANQKQGYEVKALIELRYEAESKEFSVLVSWLGFDKADNSWEQLLRLHEDIPRVVLDLLQSFPDRSLDQRALDALPS
jgi:hypothetical protein